jgi:hypothetical protein
MGESTIESRTLRRAAEILGSPVRLARHLQVPLDTLTEWLEGAQRPPNIYFLRAVDVVLYMDVIEPSGPGDVRPWASPAQKDEDKPERG